jgi:hypothetical protein
VDKCVDCGKPMRKKQSDQSRQGLCRGCWLLTAERAWRGM